MTNDIDALVKAAESISNEIEPLLAGQGPEVQGAVLANLVSVWLAGHHPEMRAEVFDMWLTVTRQLVKSSEIELFGAAGFPVQGLS